ncbi:MAG: response regulator [Chitinophagales bacterium]|nr:response regulator [Chitinophagales bacterium]
MSNEHTFPTGDQAIVAHNMVKALENERKRISFILHDTIQHQLRLIRDEAPHNIKPQIDSVIQELSGICQSLVPRSLEDFDLVDYLPVYIVTLMQKNYFFINYKSNVKRAFPKEIESQLYHILQEAITNIIKYAESPAVLIRFWEYDDKLTLSIQDVGKGFDIKHASATSNGLSSMHFRAEAIGGIYEITSEPGDGTKVKVTIPKDKIPLTEPVSVADIPPTLSTMPMVAEVSPKMSTTSQCFLLLDNQKEVLIGLEQIIKMHYPEANILTATNVGDALALLREHSVDIAISDITLPGQTGFLFIQEGKQQTPDTKFIVYSINNIPIYIARAVKLKADGFVYKEDEWEYDVHPLIKVMQEIVESSKLTTGPKPFFSKKMNEIYEKIKEKAKSSNIDKDSINKNVFLIYVKILKDKNFKPKEHKTLHKEIYDAFKEIYELYYENKHRGLKKHITEKGYDIKKYEKLLNKMGRSKERKDFSEKQIETFGKYFRNFKLILEELDDNDRFGHHSLRELCEVFWAELGDDPE